jgi:CO/xanthine dehydrogenase FAD-binding subunit
MRIPAGVAQALEWMAEKPGEWKPFAGGTDLMVLLEQGKLAHGKYLSLWALQELRGIEVSNDFVSIGALTTYSQLQRHDLLRKEFPLICRAAAETGGIANQNRGTLGGNIANASPAADSPPALLVYDADLELISTRGARWIPYRGFHTGYKKMNLAGDEIIRSIRLPRTKAKWAQFYRKVGTRKAQAISKVCLAAAVEIDDRKIRDVRIALGSVAPTVLRCEKTEALLRGRTVADEISEARRQLRAEISPLDDFRSTADYRTRVAQNLLEEFLLHAQATNS